MRCWRLPVLLLMMPATLPAQDLDPGRTLAATCANCHGTDGRARAGLPVLAGRPQRELQALLAEYKAGTRAGTVMPQILRGYSDEQLQQIARYLAAQPAAAAGGQR